ncbi:hypothetical protein HZH68_015093 [Vespula germanica]|uniref:Uncharacterized protein n=1 Tax=Vespula germanica TaxID=30212 RepID=A0A834J7J4_VESGE|nr:hypothetical protein HZH68_015093 [Vespula germanica]
MVRDKMRRDEVSGTDGDGDDDGGSGNSDSGDDDAAAAAAVVTSDGGGSDGDGDGNGNGGGGGGGGGTSRLPEKSKSRSDVSRLPDSGERRRLSCSGRCSDLTSSAGSQRHNEHRIKLDQEPPEQEISRPWREDEEG